MKQLERVLIMAAGTGGHVFPALALADYLRQQGMEVQWLGTARGLEAEVVPAAKIPLHLVSIGGLRGKNLKTRLLAPFRLGWAFLQSLLIIFKLKPSLVIGFGGYVSGPGGLAAWLLRKPLMIHEQNAKAGFTNQCLSYFSRRVFTGFPNVFSAAVKAETVGNPVRMDIATLPSPSLRFKDRSGPMKLLIFGGSLGAAAINEWLPSVLKDFPKESCPQVLHQAGKHLCEQTKAAYQEAGVAATVLPFISDMRAAYAWADFVVCRAGALTVAELEAVGLGSILIPYPHAVDDHQTANAHYLADQGAAFLIQQRDLTKEALFALLSTVQSSPEKRLEMAEAAYALRKTDVLKKMVSAFQFA